ncbi:MAG TPA: CoA transferase [Acidimicrobiales bacterium]|nr:CoA transferase [Acidimicrobiales bacterium]
MIPPLAGFSAGATGRSKAAAQGLDLLSGLGAGPLSGPGAPLGAPLGAGLAPLGAGLAPLGAGPGGAPRAETDQPDPTSAGEAKPDALISISGAGRRAVARLRPLRRDLAELAAAGLPGGVADLALGRALATAALAGWMAGRDIDVDPLAVLMQLHLPAVMAASYGSDWWPAPPAPLPAPDGGWLNADLGAPGDAEAFARLLETLGPDATTAEIAAEAQAWRLPVCDYRTPTPGGCPPWRSAPHGRPVPPGRRADGDRDDGGRDDGACSRGVFTGATPLADQAGRPALEGITVCDLTAMWAGPLATWLLAQLGARIIKVEPPSRPDGTRAMSGRGIWPGGRSRGGRGEDSATFNALNAGKDCVTLDATEDAAALRHLAASADVVIDSFSPRVMPQLGLDRRGLGLDRPDRSEPAAVTLSMPAFPPGPARDWVAYGNGIHALSGLGGHGGSGSGVGPVVPASSYPDPLAGLEAAATAVAALAGRRGGWRPEHLEVSLAGTVEPLMTAPPGPWPRAEAAVGRRLLAAARASGAVVAARDGAGIHLYPAGPFGEQMCEVGRVTSPAGVDP